MDDARSNSTAEHDHPLVKGLTPSQREAVMVTDGPVLVLAGPGSGKTRVITRRIAYLLSLGVPAWNILAVTFTNKAAGEMKERVTSLVGEGEASSRLTITTFHSLCVRLLRRYAEMGGLVSKGLIKASFNVFDADDQTKLIKNALGALQLSTTNFPPRTVLATISNAKNELIDADQFAASASDFRDRQVARVYREYQKALFMAGGVDFDDLLMLTARMLKESPVVRAAVQDRYRYLLIDEYQDTNRAQFVIASLIAGNPVANKKDTGGTPVPPAPLAQQPNICVVGDPDQSIYGWRGADLRNIMDFEQQYPGCRVVRLGDNFRSKGSILAAADRLIKNNQQRKHKPLTGTRGPGVPVEIALCRDEHHEARLVVDWMKRMKEESAGGAADGAAAIKGPSGQPIDWKDCAVFYRTNALSRVIEDAMRGAGLPYVMVRGTAFYQREEIKNALAYLRLLANPDDSVSLERIINTPARGISDTTVARVTETAILQDRSPMSVLRDVARGATITGLTPRASQSIAKFLAMLDGWRSGTLDGEALVPSPRAPLADLVERVVKESGLEKVYADEEERRENLGELVSSAEEFIATRGADVTGEAPGAATASAATSVPVIPEPEPEAEPEAEADPFNLYGAPIQEPADSPAAGSSAAFVPFSSSIPVIDDLRAYLESVALVADTDAIDRTTGAITLMTLHAAKGLEYPCVAMIGLEEGMLPHIRAAESEAALEEERRLCFVGITRSMERLLITSAKFRTIRGLNERTIPSRFLDELRGDQVTISDQSDPFGGADDDEDGQRFISGGSSGASPGHGAPAWASGGSRKASSEAAEWSPGTSVRHPQFGMGVVQQFWGGQGARVQVKFNQAGVKTLLIEYARLTRMS